MEPYPRKSNRNSRHLSVGLSRATNSHGVGGTGGIQNGQAIILTNPSPTALPIPHKHRKILRMAYVAPCLSLAWLELERKEHAEGVTSQVRPGRLGFWEVSSVGIWKCC